MINLRRSAASSIEQPADLESVLESLLRRYDYSRVREALDRVVTRTAPLLPLLAWHVVCDLVRAAPNELDLACVLRLVCRSFRERLPLPLRRVSIRGEATKIVTILGQSFVLDGGLSSRMLPEAISTVSVINTPLKHARPLLQRVCGERLMSLSVQVARDQRVAAEIADFVPTVAALTPHLTELRVLANDDVVSAMMPDVRTSLVSLRALDLQLRHSPTFGVALAAIENELRHWTTLTDVRIACHALAAGATPPQPDVGAFDVNLTRLGVCGLTITPTTIEDLRRLTNLRHLLVTSFPVVEVAALDALTQLTTLDSLSLTWTGAGRRGDRNNVWDAFAALPRLTSLVTHGLPTPQGIAALTALHNLQHLVVLNVSDYDFDLGSLDRLRMLRLTFVSHKPALVQLHTLPLSLKTLSLNVVPLALHSRQPTMQAFQRLTNLTTLSIQKQKTPGCLCSDEMFAAGFATMTWLECLALRGFPNVGLLTISAVAQLPRIRWLRLSDIDPAVLVALHVSTSLRTLEVPLTSPAVLQSVVALKQLRLLHVQGATDDDVSAISSALPRTIVISHDADMPASTPFFDDYLQ